MLINFTLVVVIDLLMLFPGQGLSIKSKYQFKCISGQDQIYLTWDLKVIFFGCYKIAGAGDSLQPKFVL